MRTLRGLHLTVIAVLIAGPAGIGLADGADDPDSGPDVRFYVAPMGSYAFTHHARDTENGYGGTLAVGKHLFGNLDLEIIGDYLHFPGESTNLSSGGLLGLGATTTPVLGRSESVAGGGIGANIGLFTRETNFLHGLFVHLDVIDGKHLYANGGLGYDVPFSLIFDRSSYFSGMALRAETLYHNDYKHPEAQLNLGLRIPIGPGVVPAPIPTPEPEPAAEVVPAEAAPSPPPPPLLSVPKPACQTPVAGERITLDGCRAGDRLILRGVNFDFDRDQLTVRAQRILDEVVQELTVHPDIHVEIDGHTDGRGSGPYNQALSDRRAASVAEFLRAHGIAADRLASRGFGKSHPIADNRTEAGRELNRRVELRITQSANDSEETP